MSYVQEEPKRRRGRPRKQPKAQTVVIRRKQKPEDLKIQLPIADFSSLSIPGITRARLGVGYVRVIDIPDTFDKYMSVNPRVPNRTKRGLLSGPVSAGILSTLRDSPEKMVLKNQGIYLLVDSFRQLDGQVTLALNDPGKHGIINGGHTYAAIREAIETADETTIKDLERAYVKLNIYQGIDADFVAEIAEGLNRSKTVDDPSLVNLQGEFDVIRKVMFGKAGEKSIAYHQGDAGDIYISEVLVYLSMFNRKRFGDNKHPNSLYNRQALGLKYWIEDATLDKENVSALINKLPDILWLGDSIRKLTPEAARNNNFKFGLAKVGSGDRAGSTKHRGTYLPFLDETVDYRVPNGWVYPVLAAFRANLRETENGYEWKVPLERILPEVIDDLVGVCVVEHRDNHLRPELIGKRESAYSQCYTKIQLYLAKRNLL